MKLKLIYKKKKMLFQLVFSNNSPFDKTTSSFRKENASKSLDMFSNQVVKNILNHISEINTNPSSSSTQDLETNLTAKYE